MVTEITDPDWEPIMKIASAIITEKGGRTSHAAIVSRELGIPAVVGTGNALSKLKTGQMITVDTSNGTAGNVYDGRLEWQEKIHDITTLRNQNKSLYEHRLAGERFYIFFYSKQRRRFGARGIHHCFQYKSSS